MAELEQPTKTIAREALRDLLDLSCGPHIRTVPRARLQARATTRNDQPCEEPFGEWEVLDIDIRPSLSPVLLLVIIATVAFVWIAAMQLG